LPRADALTASIHTSALDNISFRENAMTNDKLTLRRKRLIVEWHECIANMNRQMVIGREIDAIDDQLDSNRPEQNWASSGSGKY
jgi:hypothetical protein